MDKCDGSIGEVNITVARATRWLAEYLPVVTPTDLDEQLADVNGSQQDEFVGVLHPRQCDMTQRQASKTVTDELSGSISPGRVTRRKKALFSFSTSVLVRLLTTSRNGSIPRVRSVSWHSPRSTRTSIRSSCRVTSGPAANGTSSSARNQSSESEPS